jgi:hypothetical protein
MTIYDLDERARAAVIRLFRLEAPPDSFDPMPTIARLPYYQIAWVRRELEEHIRAMERLHALLGFPERIDVAAIWALPDGPIRREAIAVWVEVHKHIPGEQGPPLRVM